MTVAYEQMIFQPGIWTVLGVARQTILNARVRVNSGIPTTERRKRDWLSKAGWTIAVEERWVPAVEPIPPEVIKAMPRSEVKKLIIERLQTGKGRKHAAVKRPAPARKAQAGPPLSKELRHVERWAQREYKKLKKK